MVFPLAIPMALSAIKALVKFRGRIDEILAVKKAADPLPFNLPPAPDDDEPHLENMVRFFTTDHGRLILVARKLEGEFEAYAKAPTADETQAMRKRLCALYYEAADVAVMPQAPPQGPAGFGARGGPGSELRLAFYMVESHRLSNNPAVTRVLLCAADTILEFAGENAGLFIGNPRTRSIVERLIKDFAVDQDFDDQGAEEIFKGLLSAAAGAALDNAGRISDRPALVALFGALGDLRKDLGSDYIAKLLTWDGFQKLAGKYLTHVADDPGFISDDPAVRDALAAVLREAGKKLPSIANDPKAVLGILETGLAAGSASVDALISRKLGDKPLLAAVLSAVGSEVSRQAADHALFGKLATGEVFAGLYGVALRTVGKSQALLDQAGLDALSSRLVAGAAEVLSRQGLHRALGGETLRLVASASMSTLADHAELLARNDPFATRLLADVLEAGSTSVADGLAVEDLISLGDAALRAAADHPAIAQVGGTAGVLLGSVVSSLKTAGVSGWISSAGRRRLLEHVLQTVARNPAVWKDLEGKGLLQPVLQAVFGVLSEDPTRLIRGETLAAVLNAVLDAVSRRGRQFIEENASPELFRQFLARMLAGVEKKIGTGIDAENLADVVSSAVLEYLKQPFAPGGANAKKVDGLVAKALKALQPA